MPRAAPNCLARVEEWQLPWSMDPCHSPKPAYKFWTVVSNISLKPYIENQIQFANGSMDGPPDFQELTSSAICFVSQEDMTIWMLEKIALLLGFSNSY